MRSMHPRAIELEIEEGKECNRLHAFRLFPCELSCCGQVRRLLASHQCFNLHVSQFGFCVAYAAGMPFFRKVKLVLG